MDWVVGGFIVFGLLFFWAVWVFGYWLPMAREHQQQFKAQQAREKAAREAKDRGDAGPSGGPPAPPAT